MQLPVKFTPKPSQHVGNAVGAAAILFMGLAFMMGYLPDRSDNLTFGQWLGANSVRLPFLIVASAVVLFGLAALTVALLNLFSGSPFNYLTVDRFGIRSRTFFGETSFSWKELGPIRPLRITVARAMGLDRRFWIVSDTFSGEVRNDALRPLSSFNLRIPVTSYLGSSWIGGDIGPAMDATAAWLESLRKAAHAEQLNPNDAPDSPDVLGSAHPVEKPAVPTMPAKEPKPSIPDLPAMADRKFGRRDGPTVER